MTYANQSDFLEALGVPTANTVQFTDRACGSGKTKAMYRSFEHGKKYFVVVPTVGERDTVIESPEVKVAFDKPREGSYEDDYGNTRRSMLVVFPPTSGRTTALSLSLRPSGTGSKQLGQRPPTSSRDHPGRTDIAKASMGECATSC